MEDKRSELVKNICNANYGRDGSGCKNCPLVKPCAPQSLDDKQVYDARMNKAAEEIGEKCVNCRETINTLSPPVTIDGEPAHVRCALDEMDECGMDDFTND